MNSTCDKWRLNPSINPRTNRRITVGGPTYKKLEKECTTYTHKQSISNCDKWRLNPSINPRTNRRITVGGPTYKKLEKECKASTQPLDKPKPPKSHNDLPCSKPRAICPRTLTPDPQRKLSPCKLPKAVDMFHNRDFLAKQICKNLKSINVPVWKGCMSGNETTFKSNFTNIVHIGNGCFGEIYSANIGALKFVVKEAKLTTAEKNKIIKANPTSNNIANNLYPEEYRLSILIQDLLPTIPNFLYIYGSVLCDNCNVLGKPGYCFNTIMEFADSSMNHLVKNTLPNNAYYSMLYQLLIGISAFQNIYGIYHGDIKLENILVKYISCGGYIPYTTVPFSIENVGILLLIADFGVSKSFLPNYSGKNLDYGFRNATVITTPTGDKIFEPINCKYTVEIGKTAPNLILQTKRVNWVDENNKPVINSSYYNRFYGKKNVEPSIKVDLNDPVTFPPFEFFNDIQDLIRMFIGGKRMFQNGDHVGFKQMLPPKLVTILTMYLNKNFIPPKIYGVQYILASELLKNLYKHESSTRLSQ